MVPAFLAMTHLDFGGCEAAAVHPLESDGVELALVQVDHGQLTGLVRSSQRGSQGELELIPESLWWGAGVGARVHGAGLVLGEGIAVGKSLKSAKTHTRMFVNKSKEGEARRRKYQIGRLAAQETGLSFQAHLGTGVGESTGLRPLLQQGVEDDVELLLVVGVGHDAGQGGVGVRGGGNGQGGVLLGSQDLVGVARGNAVGEHLHDVGGRLQ